MKGWHLLLVGVLLGLIAIFHQGLYQDPSHIPPVIINTPAPSITAQELYDAQKEVRLSDHAGKVIVLNFWASWCRECVLEHPSLLEMNKKYQSDARFVMLGVNYQDEETAAKGYLEKHGNNFTHLRDPAGRIAMDYGIYGVPETFVIDQKGVIRYKSIGPLVGETYTRFVTNIIEPLLNGLPVQPSQS